MSELRKVKSSEMNKAIAMLVIGSIILPIVLVFVIAFSLMLTFFRPIGWMIFLTSCAIALIVPVALIIAGATRIAKLKAYIKQKPRIAQQKVITTPTTGTITTAHPKFCPECGSQIKDIDQKFCVKCGREL